MPSQRSSEGTQTMLFASPFLFISRAANALALQKCKNCQQEIDDQLPNVEAQLAEMKILEELAHGGRNVNDLAPICCLLFLIFQ
jgi:hypothetical protein